MERVGLRMPGTVTQDTASMTLGGTQVNLAASSPAKSDTHDRMRAVQTVPEANSGFLSVFSRGVRAAFLHRTVRISSFACDCWADDPGHARTFLVPTVVQSLDFNVHPAKSRTSDRCVWESSGFVTSCGGPISGVAYCFFFSLVAHTAFNVYFA
eukprot:3238510-Rhodomonas_salina.1